ncbi:hypothetical protein [Ruminiclostridium cellulolyticum]|uniref:Uncharacterized protein n=1 Tax=Ruminiclostridium cellulolyticum (strain ATCC 35319 / DSM 5812 / JCM 6584 / H10) TaxID=394503 RepID=B8I4L7_RUMCH|nr:hypothetical protein [Ruminiclostridium cellulolyticum]ACL74571.1 hypothetical protein Ccel_0183 [Ruminiclostridium cellulolyticum H10]
MKERANLLIRNLVLVVISIILTSTIVFAQTETNSLEQAKDNMRTLGFSEKIINDLSDNEIMEYLNAKLVSKTEEYYTYEYSSTFNSVTKKNDVKLVKRQKVSKEDAYKIAEKENGENLQSKVDILTKVNDPDAITTFGFNNSYNSNTISTLKLQVWATYISGTTYKIATQFDWLTHPSQCYYDMLALSNDGKSTKQQNTSSFFVKSDIYKKDIYGNSTFYTTENVVSTTTSPFKEEVTGVGYKYEVPTETYGPPISSREWYERQDLRGYLTYKISVPTTKQSYGVLGSYGHETQSLTWSNSVGVSFPAGISFSSWPSASSKITTSTVYTNFDVN